MSQTNHGGARPGAGRPRGSASDAHHRLTEAKARREQAAAELKELELAKARNELIPAATVSHAWQSLAFTVRQRFLALPSKMAGILAHRPAREIEHALRLEVRSILSEIADEPEYGRDD